MGKGTQVGRHVPHLKVRKTGTAEADVQLERGGRTNRQGQARKYPYLPWKKFPQEAQLSHASWNVQAGQQAWKSWEGKAQLWLWSQPAGFSCVSECDGGEKRTGKGEHPGASLSWAPGLNVILHY